MDLHYTQLFDRNLDLENQMVGLGHRKVMIQVYEGRDIISATGQTVHKPGAIAAKQESHTNYGNSLIESSIDIVAHHLLSFTESDQATSRTAVRKLMRQFLDESLKPADVKPHQTVTKSYTAKKEKWEKHCLHQMRIVAFIGLQALIDSLSSKSKHSAAAMRIGRALESELRFRYFALKNPALWDTIFGDLAKREKNFARRKAILVHSMYHDGSGRTAGFLGWSGPEAVTAGAKILEIIRDTTDLVEFRMHTVRKNRTVQHIEPTAETQRFMEEKIDSAGIRFPVFLPTLVSPKVWEHPLSGGYHSSMEALKPVRLVKVGYSAKGGERLRALYDKRDQMPGVYGAVNAVQSTPWIINKGVFEVMQQAWKAGGIAIGKMPQYTDVHSLASVFPLQPFNEDMRKNPEELLNFKRNRAKVYRSRVEQSSRVIQMMRMIAMAEKFQFEDAIYFPTQLDFRGRMYAMPSFLSPQGTDCAKGLLSFARGCRLGATGLKWLQIHVANMFGEDKISFDAREEWTMANYEWMKRCVESPFDHREWMDADKPWRFLAAIQDYVACVESGELENHVSQLPVTVDGTCNGLQHFSAMLLDPIGGHAVNLTPTETPQDIYQLVADRVKEKFAGMSEPLANQWLQYGFDRKATKRCVMILPYSGTLHAAKSHILEYIKERGDKGPWDDDFHAAVFFAKVVWETIEETVGSAGAVMRWLKEVATAVTKHGQVLEWTTPLGFPVIQDNRQLDQFRIDLMLGQQVRYRPTLVKESERLDANAQRLGISPNFIHSLDAACLMLTVNRAVDAGIVDYAMVHDSYGVHAGKMETLYDILRDSFVEIYKTNIMEDFLVDTTKGLSPEVIDSLRKSMPKKGILDIRDVKKSLYFFA